MEGRIFQAIDKAREVASVYNSKTLIPFPFMNIVRAKGDLEILYDNLDDNRISGAIVYDKESKKYKILVNSSEMKERQYFTLAHEVGHYFLHGDFLQKVDGKNSLVDSLDNYESAMFRSASVVDEEIRMREREANNFAAELIMPEIKVREAWDITDGDLSVEYYARMFSVSVSAMAIRMENLGLKKKRR